MEKTFLLHQNQGREGGGRGQGTEVLLCQVESLFSSAISLDSETFLNGTIITYLPQKSFLLGKVFHLSSQKRLDEICRQSLPCRKIMIVYDGSLELLMTLDIIIE